MQIDELGSPQLVTFSRRKADGDSGLIPLINIVFLLLIFFMIAGQISALREHNVILPESASDVQAQLKPIVIVVDAKGLLTIDGRQATLSEVNSLLHSSGVNKETAVALQGDKNVTAQDLDNVLTVIREAGISQISLYARSSGIEK